MEQALVAQKEENSSLIQVIARAASDPTVDIDKMQRLLDMQERIMLRQAETAFNAAMTSAQEKMRPISTDANNPQTRSKYASYAALDKALRPIYIDNGFSISFDTAEGAPADQVRVLCNVAHSQGFSRQYHVDMPTDGKGAKGGEVMSKTHAIGAGLTYGMRYLLKMVFNVAIGEDDREAPVITEDQALTLDTMLTDNRIERPKFLKYFKIKALSELPATEYQNAIDSINLTVSARKKQQ